MSQPEEDLHDLRGRLDGLDGEIVRLIARRLDLVSQISAAKAASQEGLRDAGREREVLERVEKAARELGLSAPLARKVFTEIISHSLTRQVALLSGGAEGGVRQVRVGFQGVPYAYSYLAGRKYLSGLGVEGDLTGFRTFKDAVATPSR